MRSRLFRSIVGVAIALAPSGCEDTELVARSFDAVAPETLSDDTGVATVDSATDAADSKVPDDAVEAAADTADAAEAADTNVADTYTDAPTDADAGDGWAPTK